MASCLDSGASGHEAECDLNASHATDNLNRRIGRAKPKAALLTSLTFGLSYFEAAILPALQRVHRVTTAANDPYA